MQDDRADLPELRLRCCPICDYDLRGLPARYRCPECAFFYNERMFDVALRSLGTPSEAERNIYALCWGVPMIALSLWAWRTGFRNLMYPLWFVLIAVLAPLAAWTIVGYAGRDRRLDRVLLHFDDDGLRIRGAKQWSAVYRYGRFGRVTIKSMRGGRFRLRMQLGSVPAFLRRPLVDGWFEATPAEAERIHAEIEYRMALQQ